MTSDETLELLRSAVALRVQGRTVPESVRRELATVEAALMRVVGPLVRKRVAARLLGCSVQALDRWISKGALPVEPIATGSTRMALPTEVVVAVAAEAAWLGDAAPGAAIEDWHVRRVRELEYESMRNITTFAHMIAAGKDDLIAMKRAAGRPQDLLDIERIERGGDPITGF